MTLTLVATEDYSTGMPVVRLLGTSTVDAPSPIPNNTLLEVWRIHQDGGRHRVLTEQAPRLVGGGWTWLDLHAPYNQTITYEILAGGFLAVSNAAWLVSDSAYLVHASRGDRAVRIDGILAIADRTTDTRSIKFTPIGGPSIYLTDGVRDGRSGDVTLRVRDESAYLDLFADDAVILINTPGTKGWDLTWMWLQPESVSYSNPADLVVYPFRHIKMSYTETAQPDVDLEPAWNCRAAEAYWTARGIDSGEVTAYYGTCLDFLTDSQII